MVKNPPANIGDTGSTAASGGFHMPWSNSARVSQLESGLHSPQLEKALRSNEDPEHGQKLITFKIIT